VKGNKGFAFITLEKMNDPIEVEYGKTLNFVTRENNNKKKDYPMKMKI